MYLEKGKKKKKILAVLTTRAWAPPPPLRLDLVVQMFFGDTKKNHKIA